MKCQKMADLAQADLAEALPALEEAKKALEALNKKDISEVKAYGRPPTLVEIVMQAVMILKGCDPSWAEAKRQLGKILRSNAKPLLYETGTCYLIPTLIVFR